ncbi:Tandem EPIDERMAL PATTERNING FACTOR-LIKE protein [Zostera marina]|uniref:Epidermal patterning factor-like protein n=1 Tax=Zostera marina TaxID=29655 RepID=A0A0K9PBF2_ZOSMR|nr:Tandem EPIDERMAL PATTERNING FACTOR-LIKE protein [Zostera marina]
MAGVKFVVLSVLVFLLCSSVAHAAVEGGKEARRAGHFQVKQGSTPIDCTNQCDGCTPCNQVLDNVDPDHAVWKCQCGGSEARRAGHFQVKQGSTPIDCTNQCDGCTPCNQVLDNVDPDHAVWKCQCGGK